MTEEEKVQAWYDQAEKHKTGEFTETLDLASFASLARAELEQKIAEQAAVIEKQRDALNKVVLKVARGFIPQEWAFLKTALSIPADSAQILSEIRKAEREMIVEMCVLQFGELGDDMAEAIRQMEDV